MTTSGHNQVAILQPERWERIMQRQLRLAGHLGLSPAFVKEFMDAIHRESIRRQSRRRARATDAPAQDLHSGPNNGMAPVRLLFPYFRPLPAREPRHLRNPYQPPTC